jgi:hypothetical protein
MAYGIYRSNIYLEIEQWYPASTCIRPTDIHKKYRGCLIAVKPDTESKGSLGYFGEWFIYFADTPFWARSTIVDPSPAACVTRAKRMIDLHITRHAMERVLGRKLTWEEKAAICKEKP